MELDLISEWVLWVLNSLKVVEPGLVHSIVAVPVDNMSSIYISSTMNIEALTWDVSDGSLVSLVPEGSLGILVGEVGHNDGDVDLVTLTSLVGEGSLSVVGRSDGSSSLIEDKPLLEIPWLGVSDSESKLTSTNVFGSVKGSVSSHLGFDLEFDSILKWELWIGDSLGVYFPSLSSVVLVPPEGHDLMVSVLPGVWSQDEVAPILDVMTLVVESLLILGLLPWSSNGVATWSEGLGSVLSSDNEVSSLVRSDGLGSSVEDPPLVPLPWLVVPDSEEMLFISTLFGIKVEGSSSLHGRSELESDSIFKRWLFILDDDS